MPFSNTPGLYLDLQNDDVKCQDCYWIWAWHLNPRHHASVGVNWELQVLSFYPNAVLCFQYNLPNLYNPWGKLAGLLDLTVQMEKRTCLVNFHVWAQWTCCKIYHNFWVSSIYLLCDRRWARCKNMPWKTIWWKDLWPQDMIFAHTILIIFQCEIIFFSLKI